MILRTLVKIYYRNRSVWAVLLVLLAFTALGIFRPNILVQFGWEQNPKFYIANYASFFFWFTTAALCFPLFLVLLQPQIHFFEQETVFFRLSSKRRWWLLRLGCAAVSAILYVVLLYVLMFVRAAAFGQMAHYARNALFFLQAFVSQCITYTFLAFVYLLFAQIFSSRILGCVISYGLILYDYVILMGGLDGFASSGVLQAISVRMETSSSYGINLVRILIYIVAVIVIGMLRCPKYDCLPKEKGEQK
ncbi:MAG: hypothetical protein LKE53_08280 [Oscillospiraceae bacterium]|jgi:hypothetical protein|nr:hypothetical protein [Oscillospiraceae bacterium]MDD3260463.1 hypothetical protein [Oscillospiraceae bacterium]